LWIQPVDAKPSGLKTRQLGLNRVLHRPVEIATHSGHKQLVESLTGSPPMQSICPNYAFHHEKGNAEDGVQRNSRN
jgi:hypothetical protein